MKETIRRVDEKISDLELLLLAYPDDIEGNAPMRAVIQDSIDALKYAVCEFTAQAGAALEEEKKRKDSRLDERGTFEARVREAADVMGLSVSDEMIYKLGAVSSLARELGTNPFDLATQLAALLYPSSLSASERRSAESLFPDGVFPY